MIFHDSIYDGHHMMEWDVGHWFPMVLGWGIVLFAAIVIFYIVIQSAFGNKKQGQIDIQVPKSEINELNAYEIENVKFGKVNFCYSCGEKLDRNDLKFCPKCGIKI